MKDKKALALIKDIEKTQKHLVDAQKFHKETRVWIGSAMAALRNSYGVRQGFVAEKIGCAQPFIAMLEKGRKNWTPEFAKKYLAAFCK